MRRICHHSQQIANHHHLCSRVREVLGTEAELARVLGLPRSALSARFKGATQFSRKEIMIASEALGIPQSEIGLYFFTRSDGPAP